MLVFQNVLGKIKLQNILAQSFRSNLLKSIILVPREVLILKKQCLKNFMYWKTVGPIIFNVFKNCFYTFHILWPELIRATVSEIWRIRRFYTNDAEKDTIIDDDEKCQLI